MTILLEREGVRNFCANFTPFLFNFSFEYWDWKESWAFDMDICIYNSSAPSFHQESIDPNLIITLQLLNCKGNANWESR